MVMTLQVIQFEAPLIGTFRYLDINTETFRISTNYMFIVLFLHTYIPNDYFQPFYIPCKYV